MQVEDWYQEFSMTCCIFGRPDKPITPYLHAGPLSSCKVSSSVRPHFPRTAGVVIALVRNPPLTS